MKKAILIGTIVALAAPAVMASDFFDTSRPEKNISFGARVGINTSNMTVNEGVFDLWNKNAWGTGFDIGVVANINIREYFTLQPGFFFQSRSGDYTYASTYFEPETDADGNTQLKSAMMVQFGHNRNYNFVIPVMASFRFNITSGCKWLVEVGPYFNFRLHNSGSGSQYSQTFEGNDLSQIVLHAEDGKTRTFDAGFKFGTGFLFRNHYYVGAHYMAGCCPVWKNNDMDGRNKAWTFTLGYDF